MIDLVFSDAGNFEVSIQCEDRSIISLLDIHCTSVRIDRIYDWRKKAWTRGEVRTSWITVSKSGFAATISRGMGHLLVKRLLANFIILPQQLNIIVDEKLQAVWDNTVPHFFLQPKWRDRFLSHPKGIERGQMQIDDFETISQSAAGVVSLFTGYGKTELLLAIGEAFLEQHSGNLLIFCYSNKVVEEIHMRAASYGVEIPKKFSTKSRINIVNPAGFSRSVAFRDKHPDLMAWLKDVNMCLPDEGHHLSAPTWRNLVRLTNPFFCYPFSASADVEEGGSLDYEDIDFATSSDQMLNVLCYSGFDLVKRELMVPIRVLNLHCSEIEKETVDRHYKNNPNNIMKLLSDYISLPGVGKMLAEVYKKEMSNGICFIPITTIESGYELTAHLNSNGVRAVFWSGELALIPDMAGGVTEANKSLTLEELKKLAAARAFDVLVTTSVGVEGIDLPNLSGVVPITGKSFKMTIQPLGRAARSNEVLCVLVNDRHNRLLNSQMANKRKFINSRLNVVSTRRLTWDNEKLR